MGNWVVANPVDTSKNLLHTYSHYAGIYDYFGDLDAWSGGSTIYSRLDRHIEILQKREEKFYQETLGLSGVTDFNTFIQKLKDALEGVEPFFYKLSSYDKATSLKKYIINNLQLNTQMTSGEKGKTQLENFSGQTISQNLQNQKIDVEALLSKGSIEIIFTAKKDSSTKKAVDVLKFLKKELKDITNISMLDFQEKVIPEVVKNLKGSLKGFNVSDSQLWGSLTSFLKEDIEKSIQDEVLRESFLRQIMNASAIESFLKAGKKRINIPLVKKLFKEYLFRDVKDTGGRLDKAFESIWSRYESLIISGIYSNSQGDFSGTLGEFSGAVLLYYITNGKEADWTGKDTNSYGEFKRADLVLDAMGIQAKNHKQSSLENFDLTVKLHPKELISRLASSDLIVSNNALENLIVNMGFNESTRRMLSQDFEAIMKNYLAYTMNFSLINDIEDTSNFWLIGGNMLVPASEILIAFKETLEAKEGNKIKVKLTSSYKNQTDSYFHKLGKDENGNTIKNSQPYLEYWRKKNGNWEADIDKHTQTHKNLLTSNKISIITSFNFYDIFLTKLKNFTFI